MSKSDSEITEQKVDFGSLLAEARTKQHLTVDDINQHLKIPVKIIHAIESSDIGALPPATFTLGYLRTYAKFLEISEKDVLESYRQAVPSESPTHLKYRTSLPKEPSSESPLIKAITRLLIVAGIAAAIYGGFQYYQEKMDDMGLELESRQQSFTGHSLDSPGSVTLDIRQNASMTEDGELIVESSEPLKYLGDLNPAGIESVNGSVSEAGEGAAAESPPAEEEPPAAIKDVIEIFAEKGSWMQVNDATNTRLFYNMLPAGDSKKLEGVAPFRISLGNASTTRVMVNGISVDMNNFIRPNNTAVFSVSTKDQKIIFH
jgi:cytoskeleton protein RodZ